MLFSLKPRTKYHLVGSSYARDALLEESEQLTDRFEQRFKKRQSLLIFTACIVILCLIITLILALRQGKSINEQLTIVYGSSDCPNPPTRREWRSLSRDEKQDYLTAVQCLREKPSRLGLNQSLYDDFPWVHIRFGGYCMLFVSKHSAHLLMEIALVKRMVQQPFLPGIVTSSTRTSKLYVSSVSTKETLRK